MGRFLKSHLSLSLLVDVDECEAEEDSCPGGICVNTLGSHFCTCELPLVLDDTQRSCVNSTGLAVGKTTYTGRRECPITHLMSPHYSFFTY